MWAARISGLILASTVTWAQAPPPDVLLFARARTRMQDHLKHQPNYTCQETLERSETAAARKRTSLIDVLRFEVAFVDNRELYAWPGSSHFEETSLVDMAPAGGTISTGAFAVHAHNLFLTPSARILPGEWDAVDGRRLARFPYEVAEMVSGFRIRSGRGEWVTVGHFGSIWVDPEREEVVEIEIIADQIPVPLGVQESRTRIRWGDVRISDESYRLPVRFSESMTGFSGHQSSNQGNFTGCRQFVGESKLSFGDPPPEEAATPAAITDVTLPADLSLTVQLTTSVDSQTSKTGELIEAVLSSPIKVAKQTVFEKGSRVEGRLVRMQRIGPMIYAELQFLTITSGNRRAVFSAVPEIASPPTPSSELGAISPLGRPQFSKGQRPGSVRITLQGSRLMLMKGSKSHWTTVAPPKKDS